MTPGLCSVSFRALTPGEIISAAGRAGLPAIEWGGDVHVPAGDVVTARAVGAMTRDAGLTCPSYGSYVQTHAGDEGAAIAALVSAQALGAETIRFWPGARRKASASYAPGERAIAVAAIRRFCHIAGDHGLTPSMEFHRGLLTDTLASTLALFDEVDHPALATHWQWEPDVDASTALGQVSALAGRVRHVHVFHWDADMRRHSLAAREPAWAQIAAVLDAAALPPGAAFLEFVPDDDPETLAAEAACLQRILRRG